MIVEMKEEHLEQVLEIEHTLFSLPWQRKDFLFEIQENPVSFYYVYLEEGRVVGFIGSWVAYDQGEITNLGVHPDYQRRGIGEALLQYALKKEMKVCTLEVRASNYKAKALYEKYGFKQAAVRKNYYDAPTEDALLMVKEDFE